MKRKELYVIGLILGLVALVCVMTTTRAGAASTLPGGINVIEVDGHTCVINSAGGIECWCTGECGDAVVCDETVKSLDSPLPVRPTATDIPNKTVVPYITPTATELPCGLEDPDPCRTGTPPAQKTPLPTSTPYVPTDTPEPTKTTRPTPPAHPTDTPVPTNTPEPEPTDKPKCNNGVGNGPDCPPPGHDKDGDGITDPDKKGGDNDDDLDNRDCGDPGNPCNKGGNDK